jgi:hypothetical protein
MIEILSTERKTNIINAARTMNKVYRYKIHNYRISVAERTLLCFMLIFCHCFVPFDSCQSRIPTFD